MSINKRIAAIHGEMTTWRRTLHEHPETAFEEHWTSEFVAEKLESFGVQVDRGLAGTGVVGILKGARAGDRAIGLRADIDALDIHEQTNKPYASKTPGKMHACGHDGHTTMLLGAAKYLAETKEFSGTAYFIFQPAEENEGGARVMIEDGLFKKFPMEGVYGMHNWPGMPVGEIGMREGPIMAAFDSLDITISGHGAHGAMPHQGIDPILIACQVVSGIQTIASRNVDPLESVVVSITQFHAGNAYNVIPESAELKGAIRTLNPDVQDLVETGIKQIATSIAAAHGATAEVRYTHGYPATHNAPAETAHAAAIAAIVVGQSAVHTDVSPVMGSEDFAFMLNETPGSYIWLGAGEETANLHSPQYDFNDEILPLGASYWTRLVEGTLI